MSRIYNIPSQVNKWYLIFIGIYCLSQWPNMIKHWVKFNNEPSFKTAWFLTSIILAITIASIVVFRRGKIIYVISIEKNLTYFQKRLGEKYWSKQIVTVVIETTNVYRLYSENREICISKKMIPEELDVYLRKQTSVYM